MAQTTDMPIVYDRLATGIVGGVAGAALWLMVDVLADVITNDQLYLFVTSATLAFFVVLLALVGPLSMKRAGLAAAAIAIPAAVLLGWSSLRFETLDQFLQSGHPLVAFGILVLIPMPFVIAQAFAGWRDYATLFTESWNIVVRFTAAWLFAAVFWGVIFLSNALFNIVGLSIIDDLLEFDPVPYVLTGVVFGIAISVVNELSDYISPYLVLRLLRLLLPVVLVVVAVFILALPFRGLSGVFGGLSAAGILMAMAIGATTLVTTALDQSDADAVQTRYMRLWVQVLALLIPVLAGLAVYAISVRVAQYGWTPDRLAAATIAFFVSGYAVLYALIVVMRRNWMVRIRNTNTFMALGLIVVAALWLTPVLNPQRISVNNQVARFESGASTLETIDLWSIGRDWGVAGSQGIATLLSKKGEPALASEIARMQNANNRHIYDSDISAERHESEIAFLRKTLIHYPKDAQIPDAFFNGLMDADTRRLAKACKLTTARGNSGCALVLMEAGLNGFAEMFVFYMINQNNVLMRRILAEDDQYHISNRMDVATSAGASRYLNPDHIDAIAAGELSFERVELPAIRLKDRLIIPDR